MKQLPKIDLTKCSEDVRNAKRIDIIRLWKKEMPQKEMVAATGISAPTVSRTIHRYRQNNCRLCALKEAKRGRPMRSSRTLTPEQETKILAKIVDHTPGQYKFPYAPWTRKAVRELIVQEVGI